MKRIISSAMPLTPSISPTALVASRTIYNSGMRYGKSIHIKKRTIVGRMYVKAPVSSNIITTTDTVILVIPLPKQHIMMDSKLVTKRIV